MSTRNQNWALTLIRIAVGIVFIAHGYQKLFIYGHAGVTGAMAQMGIPFPALSAWLIALTEFFGGLALLLGLFTRVAALPIAFSMIIALLQVHLKGGFFLPAGFEYVFTLLFANISLAVGGGGALALDNVIFRPAKQSAELRTVAA